MQILLYFLRKMLFFLLAMTPNGLRRNPNTNISRRIELDPYFQIKNYQELIWVVLVRLLLFHTSYFCFLSHYLSLSLPLSMYNINTFVLVF